MEGLQGIQLFSHSDKFNGFLYNGFNGKSSSPPCIPIHFGQNDSINAQAVIEILSNIDGILSGHGIRYQEHLFGLDLASDLPEFQHERLIDMKPSGGIDEHQIITSLQGQIPRLQADINWRLGRCGTIKINF